MPKTAVSIEKIQTSVRLTLTDNAWVNEKAKELGAFNDVLVQLVQDARTLYGLPDNIKQKLDADAKRQGKAGREYVIQLLSKRYEELLREELLSSMSKTKR